ncbi:hypothetical protein VNO78_35153 [Psophocarpus tetragonolobus]|uniref:Uncharacterized protein n=1 Tax=Psophocarpus tetragonolobus TaxID=3891 RepID=A0AAN9NMR3_PSOTE
MQFSILSFNLSSKKGKTLANFTLSECAILSGKLEAITFPSLVTVQSCQWSLIIFPVFLAKSKRQSRIRRLTHPVNTSSLKNGIRIRQFLRSQLLEKVNQCLSPALKLKERSPVKPNPRMLNPGREKLLTRDLINLSVVKPGQGQKFFHLGGSDQAEPLRFLPLLQLPAALWLAGVKSSDHIQPSSADEKSALSLLACSEVAYPQTLPLGLGWKLPRGWNETGLKTGLLTRFQARRKNERLVLSVSLTSIGLLLLVLARELSMAQLNIDCFGSSRNRSEECLFEASMVSYTASELEPAGFPGNSAFHFQILHILLLEWRMPLLPAPANKYYSRVGMVSL